MYQLLDESRKPLVFDLVALLEYQIAQHAHQSSHFAAIANDRLHIRPVGVIRIVAVNFFRR